jgi:eukaryotic-like serine/threonine-protein kinase
MDADIFMPICWRGLAMFPDGLGPALVAAQLATAAIPVGSIPIGPIGSEWLMEPDLRRKLQEIVANDVQAMWAVMREDRSPAADHRQESRQRATILQMRGPAGGLPRLAYTLNPLIPCASSMLNGRWIGTVGELVLALDALVVTSPDVDLLEPHITAFIGARSERLLDEQVKALANTDMREPTGRAAATLRLLSALQQRFHPMPLKGLASWVAVRVRPLVERWSNRERRAVVEEKLKTLAALGFLQPILTLLEDPPGHAIDSEGLRDAQADLDRLDAELREIAEGGRRRSAIAAWWGQEVAAGIGLAAIAITLILAALG